MCARSFKLLLVQLVFAECIFAQQAAQPRPPLSAHTIDMANATPVLGLPFTGAFALPFTCSSSGQVYVGEYAFDKEGRLLSAIPDLYRVSPLGSVKHLNTPIPTGYASIDRPSFFAGEHALVSLIGASQPIDENGKPGPFGRDSFLSVTDADGSQPKLIHLDLDFDPIQVAVFGSGGFLVLGTERTTFEPAIALLNQDGRLIRRLNVFSAISSEDSANAKEEAGADQDRKPGYSVRTGSMARFAPWGSDILLVLPGVDRSAVYHFRASGQFDRILIRLPGDEEVEGVLGSSGRENWVIRTRSAASMKKAIESHVVENPEEFLYELSSQNGEILNRLIVHGPHPGEVACAADGKLTAMWVNWPKDASAPEGILIASTPR